jgi:hypothetical protein
MIEGGDGEGFLVAKEPGSEAGSDLTDRSAGRGGAVLAFVTGLWLALLQFSHFFLLEVWLTSRATTFFVALFFWLVGFLAGLQARGPRLFPRLVVVAAAGYYASLGLLALWPFKLAMLPVAGLCIAFGGAAAGAFFPFAAARFQRVKWLLFHENNGFVLGIFGALLGAVFEGRWLLMWAPGIGAAAVLLLLVKTVRGSRPE